MRHSRSAQGAPRFVTPTARHRDGTRAGIPVHRPGCLAGGGPYRSGLPDTLGPCLGSNAQYSWLLSRRNAKRQQDPAPVARDVLLSEAREA